MRLTIGRLRCSSSVQGAQSRKPNTRQKNAFEGGSFVPIPTASPEISKVPYGVYRRTALFGDYGSIVCRNPFDLVIQRKLRNRNKISAATHHVQKVLDRPSSATFFKRDGTVRGGNGTYAWLYPKPLLEKGESTFKRWPRVARSSSSRTGFTQRSLLRGWGSASTL